MRKHDKHKQRTQRHKYLLQGLIYSTETQSQYQVEAHPKKKISYYRSKDKIDGKRLFYNTKVIDQQIAEIMKRMTITDETASALEQELEAHFNNEDYSDQELKKVELRLVKLHQVEKNLQRLVIEEGISFAYFKEHRIEIEAERAKLNDLIQTIEARRNLVKANFHVALNLAKQLDFLFEKGTFAEKRFLCETIFKRLNIDGDGIIKNSELNAPFSLISSVASSSECFQVGSPHWICTADPKSTPS